jgi:hypothetical protein
MPEHSARAPARPWFACFARPNPERFASTMLLAAMCRAYQPPCYRSPRRARKPEQVAGLRARPLPRLTKVGVVPLKQTADHLESAKRAFSVDSITAVAFQFGYQSCLSVDTS